MRTRLKTLDICGGTLYNVSNSFKSTMIMIIK